MNSADDIFCMNKSHQEGTYKGFYLKLVVKNAPANYPPTHNW